MDVWSESLRFLEKFVQAIEQRQGMMISCPEEIAFRMGFIDAGQLETLGKELCQSPYGEYLLHMLADDHVEIWV